MSGKQSRMNAMSQTEDMNLHFSYRRSSAFIGG
jgi:hypothetical protein